MTDDLSQTSEELDQDTIQEIDELDNEVLIEIDDFDEQPPSDDPLPEIEETPPEFGRVSTVIYKGGRFSPTLRDCLTELEKLLVGVPMTVTQGGFNGTRVAASAGTHAGDAADLSVRNLTEAEVSRLIATSRMLGIAAWFRTKTAKWGTRAQNFDSFHIHGVPNGWGSPASGAKTQATSYRNGKDGLKAQQADRGPGHISDYRRRTWPEYLAAKERVKKTSTTTKGTVGVDGLLGPQTVKRLQQEIGTTPDTDFGPQSRTALRKWLGVSAGSAVDAATINALQKRIGAKVDGKWGMGTTRTLQNWLNKNR